MRKERGKDSDVLVKEERWRWREMLKEIYVRCIGIMCSGVSDDIYSYIQGSHGEFSGKAMIIKKNARKMLKN